MQISDDTSGVIGRTIIYDKDMKVLPKGKNCANNARNVLFLVKSGYDDDLLQKNDQFIYEFTRF